MKDWRYDLVSLYVIPVFTIILASSADWSQANLSVIGNYYNKQSGFLLWGIVVGTYFLFYTKRLYRRAGYPSVISRVFLYLSALLLFFAVSTPYLPEVFPKQSVYHIWFAFLSPVCLLISLVLFLWHLRNLEKALFRQPYFYLLTIIVTSAALLLSLGFVTSLLEIFVTISTCFFLKSLENRIERLSQS